MEYFRNGLFRPIKLNYSNIYAQRRLLEDEIVISFPEKLTKAIIEQLRTTPEPNIKVFLSGLKYEAIVKIDDGKVEVRIKRKRNLPEAYKYL